MEIKLNLDDENAEKKLKMMLFGLELIYALDEFENKLRSMYKYDENYSPDEHKIIERIREIYYSIMNEVFIKIGKDEI